jgi:alpha-galactosidase
VGGHTRRVTTPPRIAFIGAGSAEFTRDLLSDLFRWPELTGVEIALHDIDPERLETATGVAHRLAEQLGAKPTVSAHAERRAALAGAKYVINTVQVGGITGTRTDLEVPARYGVRQTIGDTLGIGGIFRALRTSTLLRGLAADMTAVCPDAWLLNYTNPMSANLDFLHRVAPDLKAVGLCHSVHWTAVDLAGLVGVPFEETSYWSAGVNHQAWMLRWERAGQSLYPALDAAIAADPGLLRRVRVDMYRRLGYYPTETSEHSSEYVPWYLRHDAEIERLRLEPSIYLKISRDNLRTYEQTREAVASGAELPMSEATEYAPQVIHSIETGTARRIQANVPNTGLITNLPADAGVEVPALIDELGVHPLYVGDLPPQLAALNRSVLNPIGLTVQAAVTGDPRHVRHAAMLDPSTAATLTVDQIWALCDELTAAHGDLMPEPLRGPVAL